MRSLYWAGVHTAGFDGIMNSNHNIILPKKIFEVK